ncbi:putative Palmitoyltransferase SWF1 [Blattamonas nauphoetae]|uniref:Palmitoyltransferase n=1 Tax=Blattamonas nauphoetae TaxID=2049346 RepID=A0ABQ9X808_9EUKA|nr:putative Palmitoyltransferase SWF1 [Blattamonas nauphoetae]
MTPQNQILFGIFLGVVLILILLQCCQKGSDLSFAQKAYRFLTCQKPKKPLIDSESKEKRWYQKLWFLISGGKNPSTQFLYLFLSSSLIVSWFILVYPNVPNKHCSWALKYICMFNLAMAVITYLITCFVNPGWITKESLPLNFRSFPFDNILFSEYKICPHCNLPRPPRSKHCHECKRCVSKHDHHCPWFNVCIGEENFRWFLLFLIINLLATVMIAYSAITCIQVFLDQIGVVNRTIVVKGELIHFSWRKLIMFLLQAKTALSILVLVNVILGSSVLLFLSAQLSSALKNQTTYEQYKIQMIEMNRSIAKRLLQGHPDGLGLNTSKVDVDQLKEDLNLKIVNKYNKGRRKNLGEVIFPIINRPFSISASECERGEDGKLRPKLPPPPTDLKGRTPFQTLIDARRKANDERKQRKLEKEAEKAEQRLMNMKAKDVSKTKSSKDGLAGEAAKERRPTQRMKAGQRR